MATSEQWKNRISVRTFDQNFIPDIELISEIENCLNYLPVQITQANKDKPNFLVFRLNPEDKPFKEFLVRNVFFINNPDEYFTELYEAPYTYIFVDMEYNKCVVEPDTVVSARNLGVACGALVSEAISRNIDICQIACVQEPTPEKLKTIRIELHKRFPKEIETFRKLYGDRLGLGNIVMGIGLGFRKNQEIYTRVQTYVEHEELKVPTEVGRKITNRTQPFMFVKNV